MILKTNLQGITTLNGRIIPCSVGRNGFGFKEKEGDGLTPIGIWKFEEVFYRADRVQKPETILSTSTIQPDDGWCDEPSDLHYNQKIKLPYPASHENLWRADSAYNLILTTNYNRDPIIAGKGSAVFIHLMRFNEQENPIPTEGCLGLNQKDLEEVLSLIEPNSYWQVGN
jgi:L,D-peptidoglycan transpeptidase YkuD (ErfK/YbiS/YcfS/YnhG family)